MENFMNLRNEPECWSVYKLTCENTPKIIYIGITNEDYIVGRLFRHFGESVAKNRTKNEEKHEWVRENWRDIQIIVLESNIVSEQQARNREANFVKEYIKNGYSVLNKTYVALSMFDLNGNHIKDFSSYYDAANEFNVSPSAISSALYNNSRFLGKYIFKKLNPEIKKIEVKHYKTDTSIRDEVVLQCDIKGNVIKEWDNMRVCYKTLNIDQSSMCKLLKDFNKTWNGSRFKYKNINLINGNPIQDTIKYKVFMFSLENKLIEKFRNYRECANYLINHGYTTGKLDNVATSISKSIKKGTTYLKNFIFKNKLE